VTPPPEREQLVRYAWGTPISLALGRNFIDWRASRMRAYGHPAADVCPDVRCGCLLEAVPAHSPRCRA
jgi:hypothetical protein